MTYKKKLIEVALPLVAINEQSTREKSIRYGHPSTLHHWWARRPLAAARAVLWASLVDDPSARPEEFPTEEQQEVERKRLLDLLARLVPWEATRDVALLAEARREIIRSAGGELPKILDPFSGGGAIPLESIRLGLPTFAGDLNPVAVLLERAILQIPSRFAGRDPVSKDCENKTDWAGASGLAADVASYGKWIQGEAWTRIGSNYPDVVKEDGSTAKPIAWIWARTIKSPDPSWNGYVPLVKNWTLSKRPKKPTIWVEGVIDRVTQTIKYEIREGGEVPLGTIPEGRGGTGAICWATGVPIPFEAIREASRRGELREDLIAIVVEDAGGRSFVAPSEMQIAASHVDRIDSPIRGEIFDIPGRINVVRYGFTQWSDLFTSRQLLALATFSDLVKEAWGKVREDAVTAGFADDGIRFRDGGLGADAYADAVVTYLAFAVDKASNLWSSIVGWMNDRGALREVFTRAAIPMTWDFAEANPFSGRGGDWSLFIDKIQMAIEASPIEIAAEVVQRDARERIKEVGQCVISTDPPYYDNIHYSDASDYFYVWLSRNLREVWPDECATLLTPKVDELVANQYRSGSKAAAKEHFESGMREVFNVAVKNAHPDYPATIFYAFKATETTEEGVSVTGWETFLAGLLDAGYTITATWPIRTESPGRLIASGTNALASSVVLACRPRQVNAPMATRGELITALRQEMDSAIRLMQRENIAPVDLAQSAMGPGIAVFSRYSRVIEADGAQMKVRTALTLINEILSEVLNGEESEFDADTRFALTWFEQYGHNPGPFGDADLLARAKDTSVLGVCEAGVAASRDGKVRLLERRELSTDWDPTRDDRLTVWETTQHLIRAIDSSEAEAARLLTRLGMGLGERARQLAYLLYGVSDRKKWTEDANAYNMLVMAWPEISKLAAAGPTASVTQPEALF